MSLDVQSWLVVSLALSLVLYKLSGFGRRETYLPPGPPTVPIAGNAHIFPTSLAYHQLTRWAREYGPIYSLKIGSGTAIVMSTAQVMQDVLEKNQKITADRPPNHFIDLVTDDLNVTMARYGKSLIALEHASNLHHCVGPKWRMLRRGAHEILTAKAAMNHRPIQDAESTQLAYELLTSPEVSMRCYACVPPLT